jgi:type IV secretory pathway TraG/TraD family ATPase VirD4
MKAAFHNAKTKIETNDYLLAADDWLHFWPEMADRTRTSISAGIMGILHLANTGIIRELTSGKTNCSPLDMSSGKFILLNMTPAEYGPAATYIGTGLRLLTQMTVLRRQAAPEDFINVIILDEFQQSCNQFDSQYLALCRSFMGCMVCLTQSLPSIYGALNGESGRYKADALLTNFQTRIFHAIGDEKTADYASSLIGKSLQTFIGGSMSPEEDVFSALLGRSQFTGSFSQHYDAILQSNLFMNGLRTGGPANNYTCDAIVIRSGEPFANGANWLKVEFSQR